MSLEGLRAWIREVERKLAMRTRVFLVLVAVAIGGAGAGIYLAVQATDEAATTDEVSALESRLGAPAGGEEAQTAQLEGRVAELEARVEALESSPVGAKPKEAEKEPGKEPKK
jgi:uncharacterized protein HemX